MFAYQRVADSRIQLGQRGERGPSDTNGRHPRQPGDEIVEADPVGQGDRCEVRGHSAATFDWKSAKSVEAATTACSCPRVIASLE